MNLFQILLNIHNLKNDDIIYAIAPWTLESEAILIGPKNKTALSKKFPHATEYKYFLSVALAKAISLQYEQQNTCLEAHCMRMIEFAITTPEA